MLENQKNVLSVRGCRAVPIYTIERACKKEESLHHTYCAAYCAVLSRERARARASGLQLLGLLQSPKKKSQAEGQSQGDQKEARVPA